MLIEFDASISQNGILVIIPFKSNDFGRDYAYF